MRKFYQQEWFGIDFKPFVKLDAGRVADKSFYDKFYDEFYKRYKSYEELPESWRDSKKAVADFVLRQSDPSERILSIGCGSGYVEYLLRKEGKNITAIEPSLEATRFLEQFSDVKIYHGYFPECLDKTNSFDLAYMNATEYVFDKNALIKLLNCIKDYGVKRFLLVSASIYDGRFAPLRLIKDTIKLILFRMSLYGLGQFLGYMRTPDEFTKAFKEAGFEKIEMGFIREGIFWIKGEI